MINKRPGTVGISFEYGAQSNKGYEGQIKIITFGMINREGFKQERFWSFEEKKPPVVLKTVCVCCGHCPLKPGESVTQEAMSKHEILEKGTCSGPVPVVDTNNLCTTITAEMPEEVSGKAVCLKELPHLD